MAIAEFSETRERKKVAYFGEPPSAEDEKEFSNCDYDLLPYTEADLTDPAKLLLTDSVIISQSVDDKTSKIIENLGKHIPTLLNFDCRVYVRVVQEPEDQGRGRATIVNALQTINLPLGPLSLEETEKVDAEFRERVGLPLAPFVYVCDVGIRWFDIARLIRNNSAGKAPNLDVDVQAFDAKGIPISLANDGKLAEVRKLLVQRAFWDCSTVHLIEMIDGLSGVPVYRAYSTLAGGALGPWPFLSFVKIGSRQKIAAEYENYRHHALAYVPFHLGPRLNMGRCALGAREGVLVGDFVESAEALRDCANSGRAAPVIGNLFNKTLRAWQHVSKPEHERSIADCYGAEFPTEFPSAGREALIRSFGAKSTPSELRDLFMLCTSTPVRMGPIHGDLHATNVLIRSSDAIVIDFEKFQPGMPLVYDAASLEAGLLVEGFVDDKRPQQEWLSSIEPLYDKGVILGWGEPCHPKDPSTWFYDCVHQIRIHARQVECQPGQYAAVLAFCLVKKACKPHPFGNERERLRAAAYFLAEKILKAI